MKIIRHKTKTIKIGNVRIGGNNPIAIQSMTKTRTADIKSTTKQIEELASLGAEIVRLAVRDSRDAEAIKKIKQEACIPLVADIHFDWRLALQAIDNGADKIRLNPGNIYKKEQIKEIVSAAKLAKIPIRVGVNSGSVRKPKAPRLSGKQESSKLRAGAQQLVDSALDYIRILERLKFYDIVISLKASSVLDTIEAYRKISKLCAYPLHLGVTATGLPLQGAIKSSVAIGALLLEGIGDTLRISLTDRPQEEVRVARAILEALGLRSFGPEIISCPTCGRCEVNLVEIVRNLENKLAMSDHKSSRPLKMAVMGCMVNGPGEASEADIGVAFGRKQGLLFTNGRAVKKVYFSDCIDALLKEMRRTNV